MSGWKIVVGALVALGAGTFFVAESLLSSDSRASNSDPADGRSDAVAEVRGASFLAPPDDGAEALNEAFAPRGSGPGGVDPVSTTPAEDPASAQDATNPARIAQLTSTAAVPTAGSAPPPPPTSGGSSEPQSSGPPPMAGAVGSGHGSGHGAKSQHSHLVPQDSTELTFDQLASFWYEPPDVKDVLENPDLRNDEQFPEFLRAQHGTKVTIEGYVTPISIEKGRVTAFILSRYVANCCFGMMPEINEWVDVTMPEGEGLEFIPYGTVLVTGEFEVGEVFDEYGYVRSVYRLQAEDVLEPGY